MMPRKRPRARLERVHHDTDGGTTVTSVTLGDVRLTYSESAIGVEKAPWAHVMVGSAFVVRRSHFGWRSGRIKSVTSGGDVAKVRRVFRSLVRAALLATTPPSSR